MRRVIYLLFLPLFSCVGNKEVVVENLGDTIVESVYDDDVLVERQRKLKEEGLLIIEKYNDGLLKDSVPFVEGEMEGRAFWRNENGDYGYVNYVNGVLEGGMVTYGVKGDLKVSGRYVFGAKDGIWRYYESGKEVAYEVCKKDSTFFLWKLGADGNVVRCDGDALNYLVFEPESVKDVGESVMVKMYLASPENTVINATLSVFNCNGELVLEHPFPQIKEGKVYMNDKVYCERGNQRMIEWEIVDTINGFKHSGKTRYMLPSPAPASLQKDDLLEMEEGKL